MAPSIARAELHATLAAFFEAMPFWRRDETCAVRLHRAPSLALRNSSTSIPSNCRQQPLPALRALARGPRRRRTHADLPSGLHEQSGLDVRPHAAAPRPHAQCGPRGCARLCAGLHWRQRLVRAEPTSSPRASSASIPATFAVQSLLPAARALCGLGEPGHLGIPPRLHRRGARLHADAPLGAASRRTSPTTSSTRIAPISC